MRPILLKQEMSPTWTAMFDSRKSIRLARRHTADQAQEAEAQIE
jgi:hypothetical protein